MNKVYLTHFTDKLTEYHPNNRVNPEIEDTTSGVLFQLTEASFIDPYRKKVPSRKMTRRMNKVDYLESVRYNKVTIPRMRNLEGMREDLQDMDVSEYYDVFQIPKSSGGYRTIKAPQGVLKSIQSSLKLVLEEELKILPHQNAYAYVKGRSVYDAVAVHQENESNWFLKVDLENFFDNTTPEVVFRNLKRLHPIAGMAEEDREALFDLINTAAFLDGGLPQGTPLSPTLTNLVMVEFDVFMTRYAYDNGHRYTRYADDIILSSKYKKDKNHLVKDIERILERCALPYTINASKTRYGSRGGRNWNLGLMLNKDNKITVGHKRKKRIKNALFNFHLNEKDWDLEDTYILRGNLEWLRANEPEYFEGLIEWFDQKHNTSILARINRTLAA